MFQPKETRPQWAIIYDHLKDLSIDDVVTDQVLKDLLPGTPWGSIMTAFRRAGHEMLIEHRRAFARVRKIGYRMVESREQEGLAMNQHRKAKRRTKAAKNLATHVDQSRLTQTERRRLSAIEDHLTRQQGMMDRLSERQLKVEQRVAVTEKESGQHSDRIDQLEEKLRRHGIID